MNTVCVCGGGGGDGGGIELEDFLSVLFVFVALQTPCLTLITEGFIVIYPSVLWGQNHGSLCFSECTCGIDVQRCWSTLSWECLPFSVLPFHLQNLLPTHFALTQPIKIWSRIRSCSHQFFFRQFQFIVYFRFNFVSLFPHIQ